MKCYIPTICDDKNWISLFLDLHSRNTDFSERVFIVPELLKDLYYEITERFEGALVAEQNDIVPGLNLRMVKLWLRNRNASEQRAGWYFQQFIKMGLSGIVEDSAYAVWDIDTLPINPVSLKDREGYLFIRKREHHIPYFDTINVLTGGNVSRNDPLTSFVAEVMVFDAAIMRSLLHIMLKSSVDGASVFEKVINAISPNEISKSGFSEFEAYGNYVTKFFPGLYRPANLRTLRTASYIISREPSSSALKWAGRSFDILTIEDRSLFNLRMLFESSIAMRCVSAQSAALITNLMRNSLLRMAGKKPVHYDWL